MLIRDINERFKMPKKLSSFTNKGLHGLANEDEGADFNEMDIDEKPSETRSVDNAGVLHRSFEPRNFHGRMLPATPGFGEKKSLSYLKSIATPMQSRRMYKSLHEDPKFGAYFQRLAERKNVEETKKMLPSKPVTEKNLPGLAEPASIALTGNLMLGIVRAHNNHANDMLREPQIMIPEASNSSGTEGPDKFDTAMSHPSPSVSINEGVNEQVLRKDTPTFGYEEAKRLSDGKGSIPKKSCTVPAQPGNSHAQDAVKKINSVKQRLREDLQITGNS